jgi:hypothetical protein
MRAIHEQIHSLHAMYPPTLRAQVRRGTETHSTKTKYVAPNGALILTDTILNTRFYLLSKAILLVSKAGEEL